MTTPTDAAVERLTRFANLCAQGTWTVQRARREVYGVANHSHSLPADVRAILTEREGLKARLIYAHGCLRTAQEQVADLQSALTLAQSEAFQARQAVAGAVKVMEPFAAAKTAHDGGWGYAMTEANFDDAIRWLAEHKSGGSDE